MSRCVYAIHLVKIVRRYELSRSRRLFETILSVTWQSANWIVIMCYKSRSENKTALTCHPYPSSRIGRITVFRFVQVFVSFQAPIYKQSIFANQQSGSKTYRNLLLVSDTPKTWKVETTFALCGVLQGPYTEVDQRTNRSAIFISECAQHRDLIEAEHQTTQY